MSTLAVALNRLLENDGELPASAFTLKQRMEIEQFARNTRLISITKKGRSVIYQALNRDRIVDYLRKLQPLTDEQLNSSLPGRSKNIGREKSSKKGRTAHDAFYLLMKSWHDAIVWRNDGVSVKPTELTQKLGVAALQISQGDHWTSDHPLWLIENQALFDRVDWLPEKFDGCLMYYSGQLPNLFIQWLSESRRCSELVFFPDYDGVGLSNYLRLFTSLHSETSLSFYWMPNWENKLQQFGSEKVWLDTRNQFEKAITQLGALNALNDDFSKLARLAQKYGKALEQEAIWL